MDFRPVILTVLVTAGFTANQVAQAVDAAAADEFKKTVQPVLEEYCYDCHGDGENRGGVALDAFNSSTNFVEGRDVWWRVLKNLRAGLMPPAKKAQPSKEQKELIVQWIKHSVFLADPLNPDPGRVTIRRLNRVEYQNTIRDLIGVDFDAQGEFPPDDTGHGFDNIGDVLTMSPMLLEKYMVAAEEIIAQAVPVVDRVPPEQVIPGAQFQSGADGGNKNFGPRSLSYYSPAFVTNTFSARLAGQYQLNVDLMVNEKYVDDVFDYNKCLLIFRVDGKELLKKEFSWEGGKPYHFNYDQDWAAGDHQLDFELRPLTPGLEQTRTLSLQITGVTVRGPMAKENWVKPKNYARFFPKDVPETVADRREYAQELLGDFARRAFRRPVDNQTPDRLADLAESVYEQPGKTFEAGVAEAMVAVLASPRFIFREESAEPASGQPYALVDEFALASRLSYFLWSSMPDEELFQQAAAGTLRENLSAQVARMLADKRAVALEKNFVGQWLQARDIETVPIEARSVLAREQKFDPQQEAMRKRFRELNDKTVELTQAEKDELASLRTTLFRSRRQPRADLTPELRRAMQQETEDVFDYILREDRSLLELLDSDYTFVNERLARHYGITNVVGQEMRRVTLPPDSPRGGILTEGTVLAVTSNPTRTSPVKRGVFILDNILGTPPLPPPPNIPPLEDALKGLTNRAPTLRESLAVHRENVLCASCHDRMDPLGLALENFNAMGMWRDQEFGQPIDPSGKLVTGEEFSNIKDLKRALVKNHAEDFYRTLTQKLLTYALGRGLDYYDVETVDQIVARIEKSGGKPSALLAGIIESAPFQKTRVSSPATAEINLKPDQIVGAAGGTTKERL
jgi:mono/diheme cytochrome c family protein